MTGGLGREEMYFAYAREMSRWQPGQTMQPAAGPCPPPASCLRATGPAGVLLRFRPVPPVSTMPPKKQAQAGGSKKVDQEKEMY